MRSGVDFSIFDGSNVTEVDAAAAEYMMSTAMSGVAW
jgi:hypothetical protein